MGKVYENTKNRLHIYSNDGVFRFIATRRAISESSNGMTYYYGSQWYIETHRRNGNGFERYIFHGLKYVVSNKKAIYDLLSKSVQFSKAYAELTGK